ncbi:MAG: L-rhamnose mutarotase [Bacteroidota bacterium]|nr:L-rhamnose mutarotase [Bacteroidota bacterium]
MTGYLSTTSYTMHKRFCKTLELKNDPALIEEYKNVHRNVWREITQGMKDVGILDMEIYLFGARLFMIMDTVPEFDHDKAMAALATKPRQREWEAFVSRFQKASADATADEKWQLMERVYKLDEKQGNG